MRLCGSACTSVPHVRTVALAETEDRRDNRDSPITQTSTLAGKFILCFSSKKSLGITRSSRQIVIQWITRGGSVQEPRLVAVLNGHVVFVRDAARAINTLRRCWANKHTEEQDKDREEEEEEERDEGQQTREQT